MSKPEELQQRYFTEDELKRIIEAAAGQNCTLFALLAGPGVRIGEAAGLHVDDLDLDNLVISVRRRVWNGQELSPRTRKAVRQIDIDPGLAEMLRQHHGERKAGRVFQARNGSPISAGNVRRCVLQPLLKGLRISKAGLHAFQHSRVTMLRKRGTPPDLQRQWIGRSSLRTTNSTPIPTKSLNTVSRQATRLLVWMLDPMDPNSMW